MNNHHFVFRAASKQCAHCLHVAVADSAGNVCEKCGGPGRLVPGPVMRWYAHANGAALGPFALREQAMEAIDA